MSTPVITTAIRAALAKAGAATMVMRPARVTAFRDPATVDVQPLGLDVVVENVPVVYPGSGGVRVRFPIAAGDSIMLVFADIAIDEWLASGRFEAPADPRSHDVTDAVAIPGLLPGGKGNKAPTIEFTGSGTIEIGGSSALVTLAEFNAHTHPVPGVTTGAGATTSSAPAPIALGTTILKGG
jgi:hypothetical protein